MAKGALAKVVTPSGFCVKLCTTNTKSAYRIMKYGGGEGNETAKEKKNPSCR